MVLRVNEIDDYSGSKYPLLARWVIYLLSTSQYQEQSSLWEIRKTLDIVKLVQDRSPATQEPDLRVGGGKHTA